MILLTIPVLWALVISVFTQKSIALTTNKEKCNAMADSILTYIEDTVALKALRNQPEYVADVTRIFDVTLKNQFLGSKKQIAKFALKRANVLNRNDDKKAVQDIKDNGIEAIVSFRTGKTAEFMRYFGDQIYSVAKAKVKNPDWDLIEHHTKMFSLNIIKFCVKSIDVVDGIKIKIIADISSFAKRTAKIAITNDRCATMANQIIQRLSANPVWNASNQETISTLYRRIIGPASDSAQKATTAISQTYIVESISAARKLDTEAIEWTDAMTINNLLVIDMKTFSNHFGPRFQQLLVGRNLQTRMTSKILLDIANFCRGALNDYEQIGQRTKVKMEKLIMTLPDDFEQLYITEFEDSMTRLIWQSILNRKYNVNMVFTDAWRLAATELNKLWVEMHNQVTDGIEALRLKIYYSRESESRKATKLSKLASFDKKLSNTVQLEQAQLERLPDGFQINNHDLFARYLNNIAAAQPEVAKYGERLYAEFWTVACAINRAGEDAFVRLHAINSSAYGSGSASLGSVSRPTIDDYSVSPTTGGQPIPQMNGANVSNLRGTSDSPRDWFVDPKSGISLPQTNSPMNGANVNNLRGSPEWFVDPKSGISLQQTTLSNGQKLRS